MDLEAICWVCEEDLSDSVTVKVTKKGLDSMIKVSKDKRKDGHHRHLMTRNVPFLMHESCRQKYSMKRPNGELNYPDLTRKPSTPSFPYSPTKKKVRKSLEGFNLKEKCFICGQDASEQSERKKSNQHKQPFSLVVKGSFNSRVHEIVNASTHSLCKEINKRIASVDLVAAGARYHIHCRPKLLNAEIRNENTSGIRGRPLDGAVTDDMEKIYEFLETSNDLQFSLTELKALVGISGPTISTIKDRLTKRYGDDIIFLSKTGSSSYFCFRDSEFSILQKSWRESKKNEEDEKLSILKSAAAIIRQEISECPNNRQFYPPSDSLLDNLDDYVPHSLNVLMDNIILFNKKGNLEPYRAKVTSINHSILNASRPKSFLSPLQLGLAVLLHRKYACKLLIDILFYLGVCASYTEVNLYQDSVLLSPPRLIKSGFFFQFVFDNADFNTNTLDGKNTFHSMGGIQVVTPSSCFETTEPIRRLERKATKQELAKVKKIEFLVYEGTNSSGYNQILIENLPDHPFDNNNISNADLVWLYGKANKPELVGWNGWMKMLTNNEHCKMSTIVCLPFVNSPPSDLNTIYSVLSHAAEVAKQANIHTCFVTFDQPLFQKAFEMVKSSQDTEDISKIIVRLGGFHLLMSFLGSIGYIMDGSGLEEALSVCYAPASVKKMLQGHAYSRAVRGHTLIYGTLCKQILKELTLEDEELHELTRFIDSSFSEKTPLLDDILESPQLSSVNKKFLEKMVEIEQRGRTGKLWIQYIRMVALAKSFIRAERMGSLETQLSIIEQMIPYFYSSGHFNYCKSAHLYVREMRTYIKNMERLKDEDRMGMHTNDDTVMQQLKEYNSFVKEGYFTVRRKQEFFGGNFTDITIEQDYMRTIKTVGGLIPRGFTENVSLKFMLCMPPMVEICQQVEQFCQVRYKSSEQHVDASDSRIRRDAGDTGKIEQWFASHDPFPFDGELISLATGIHGSDDINCYDALAVGKKILQELVESKQTFAKVSFKRKSRVKPLSTVSSSIKIDNEIIPVDPTLIFQRICVAKKSNEDLKDHFKYELAPFPMSMFQNGSMRKTPKSALFEIFEFESFNLQSNDCVHIIDGGMLLHRVPFHQNDKLCDILSGYVTYLKRRYSQVIVVFDGYALNCRSTKAPERSRRTKTNSCPDISLYDDTMEISVSQEKFLSNQKNKTQLIDRLKSYLIKENITVRQASDDADLLIVTTALEQASTNISKTIVIVAEDTDVLVLLISLTPPDKKIYFLKQGKDSNKYFSSKSFDAYPYCKENLLLLHAFTGCDTTSCFFRKGKKSVIKSFEKKLKANSQLRECVESFKVPDQTQDVITENGIKILLALYNSPNNMSNIDYYRYICFLKAVVKKTAVNLAILPPSSDAARFHILRVYLQVQQWLSNDRMEPEEWGWQMEKILVPIKMQQPPAPTDIMKMIFCKCQKGCSRACTCRRAGLLCTSLCGSCLTKSCDNFMQVDSLEEEEENNFIDQIEDETEGASGREVEVNIEEEVDEEELDEEF